MVIGRSGAGKSTLLAALAQEDAPVRKTQMVEYRGWVVDTPGEYAELPRFHGSLRTTAMHASLVLVVQDALAHRPTLPPGFCRAFPVPVVGVVTKIDRPDARPAEAESHLEQSGVPGPYVRVSALTGEGLDQLHRQINRIREEGST